MWRVQLEKSSFEALIDVIRVLQAPRLEWSYIQQWTDQHGTTELLNRLKSELGI